MKPTKKEDSTLDACANTSQVTPAAHKSTRAKNTHLALVVALCVCIVAYMSTPTRSKAEKSEDAGAPKDKAVLAENLGYLKGMRRPALVTDTIAAASTPVTTKSLEPEALSASPKNPVNEETLVRMNAPSHFDIERAPDALTPTGQDETVRGSHPLLAGHDDRSAFVNSQNDINEVSAQKLPHPSLTIAAGEMIPATLETAIDSDLPGMVRAVTTHDVYSLLGAHVLIPRGAALIGQFQSAVSAGQNRILIVWSRVQMNDGVIVSLQSPGVDRLGRAGQGADSINRHFMERFATASLLSVLGGVSATAGVNSQDQFNSAAQYRTSIATNFQKTAGEVFNASANISPSLRVNQGAKINVFVARDLDFNRVGLRHEPRLWVLKKRQKAAPWK